MKHFSKVLNTSLPLVLSLVFFAASPVMADHHESELQEQEKADSRKVELSVEGMHCGGCANRVGKALSEIDGVIEQEVSFSDKSASITYNPDKVSEDDLKDAIKKLGFSSESAGKKSCSPGCSKSCCS